MEVGCSSFSWQTADGRHLLGRTYDQFGDLAINKILSVSPGVPCPAGLRADPEARPGRHGYTGMAVLGFGEPIVVDGVNTAGLMGALLHYPGCASYPRQAAPGKRAVHPGRLLAWLLSGCGDLEQAAAALGQLDLVDDRLQGDLLAAHYILSDATGETAVVEPDPEGLRLHRRTIGVLTNSPGYLWHLTNLRSYVGATALPKPAQTVAGHQVEPFGLGAGGGFGLPGDWSSPTRFVRMAFVKENAVPGRDELDGVGRMFRALAPVEIPEGVLRSGSQPPAFHQTLCICAMCAESGVYYCSTAQDRRIGAVRPMDRGTGTAVRTFELSRRQDVRYLN